MVTVYQAAAPVDGATLTRAEALLAELPLPTGLPSGSWLPLRPNALFVGREPDLLALAATLKAGGMARLAKARGDRHEADDLSFAKSARMRSFSCGRR